MRCAAVLHGPRRLPTTGPLSAAARLWMKTATACATMPKTVHEPTATAPDSTLGTATALATAMDTVAALAVVMAMVWALAADTVLGLTMAQTLAMGLALVPLPATLLARARIMVGAAGAGSAAA